MIISSRRPLYQIAGACLLALSLNAQAAKDFDSPGSIRASEVVPQKLRSGTGFKVMDEARADGMLCSFSLWTPFGWYRPESAAMLEERINEARAMAVLDSMRDDPLFLEGLADHAGATVVATGKAVLRPVQTLRGIPMGLEQVGRGIQARADHGKVAGESGRMTYQREKRALAMSVGVDPYSSNEQLQNLLNTISSHRNAGVITGKIGTMFIPGGTGIFIRAAQMNKSLQAKIIDQSAPQLQKSNAEALRKLGCDEGRINAFLSGKGYTATRCTVITDCLTKLAGMQGIPDYLCFFRPAAEPEISLYYETQAEMAMAFHLKTRRLSRFQVVADTAVFTDSNGGRHVFAPVDRLLWTSTLQKRVNGISGKGKLDLWITGTATDNAKENLSEKGITLHEKAGESLFASID